MQLIGIRVYQGLDVDMDENPGARLRPDPALCCLTPFGVMQKTFRNKNALDHQVKRQKIAICRTAQSLPD